MTGCVWPPSPLTPALCGTYLGRRTGRVSPPRARSRHGSACPPSLVSTPVLCTHLTGARKVLLLVVEMMLSEYSEEGDDWICAHTELDSHGMDVNCVAWNPRETSILASCSDDETVKIWSVG